MKTGTEALPTWIPLGGFRLDHRKGKTPEGAILTIDWLLPAWASDDLTAAHPCADQPCLHRVLATCPQDQVVHLAGLYGLLTASGKNLPPEPVDIWCREMRELRNATALWDAIAGRDEAALRRALAQQQAAKGKALLLLARGASCPAGHRKDGRRPIRTGGSARRRTLSVRHPPPAPEAHRCHLAAFAEEVAA